MSHEPRLETLPPLLPGVAPSPRCTDQAEHRRRDRVMRRYFECRDWDPSPEYLLKRHLVIYGNPGLSDHPYLVDDGWPLDPDVGRHGRGDLVFAGADGRLAAVEVRYLEVCAARDRAAPEARVERARRRRLARERALASAQALHRRTRRRVEAFVYTNDGGLSKAGAIDERGVLSVAPVEG